MDFLSLSSSSALFLVLLKKAGGACPRNGVMSLLGNGMDIQFILNECKNANMICINEDNICLVRDIDEDLFISSFTFFPRNYPTSSIAFCLALFIKKDYLSFLQACNKIIYHQYLSNNIDTMHICYEIIAKMILKIKITSKNYSSYIDFISIVKNIQKYATRILLNSKYVFYVFYKVRAYAYYIGDMRTIYFVNLSLGAFNVVSKDLKKIIKNHNLMKSGVDGIFALKDEELIMQYADLISLFYLLNGDYKKNISFYTSIIHKFSNSQEDRSVFIRVTFCAALCTLYTTMYRKSDYIIENSMKYVNDATLFEKKLIYSIRGYIYMVMKNKNKASEIFLNVYNMDSYKKSFAHKIFISYFIYFIYALKKHDDMYSDILKKIINNNYIEHTYIFTPGYFEFVTSEETRKEFKFNYDDVVLDIKNNMKSPFPLIKAISMRVYGHFLLCDFNRKKEAEEYILNSIDICKYINAHSEYAKGCISLAEIYEDNDKEAMMEYLNKAWYHYIRTHWPKWPKKYENLDLKNSFEGHLSIIYSRNFFINLRHQNFFGYNQSVYAKILKSIILTFPFEKGIFIRYSNNNAHVEACENIDKNIFLSDDFEHKEDMDKAILNNKYVIVSKSKKTDEDYIADIDVYFFIPFKIDDEQYVIYCCGEMRGKYNSTLSQEFFDIITEYIVNEIINQKQKPVVPLKKKQIEKPVEENEDYIYRSVEMKKLIQQADRIAAKDTTVLLLGESGVGKEVLARRIHQQSGRSGAFVGVNIASTPQELFESEFYGHEKGSFTGANYQKKGLFELADNGTLFIDEVGDIPIPLQIKLLRVLQERQFMRVGGTKLIHSNFRLVAATNRNLLEKVKNGTFREDLYYRLNVVPINIPPLRERPEDIRALAQFFLEHFSKQYDMEIRPIPQHLWEKMLSYDWPGNVRQLKNLVERYCLYMDSDLATFTSINNYYNSSSENQKEEINIFDKNLTIKELNDAYFEYMFKKKNGIISGKNSVISVLGISKPTAHAWMNRLHLRDKYSMKLVSEDSEN